MAAPALQPHLSGTSSTRVGAGTANAAQPSTLEALGTQPTAAEQQRVSDLQEQFQQQAQKDPAGFRTALRAAFGDKAGPAQIDQLLDLALAGKLPMPSNIQFVETGSLGSGALGAYDASNGGSLYLDRSLLSDPEKLQSVFNEEMGHHLDALLGGADAAGDEGAVFSRTLESGPLSQQELTALKSEDDHGVIQIGGRWVQVEFHEEGDGESSDSGDSGGDTGGGDTGGSTESTSSAESSVGECSAHDTGNTNDTNDTKDTKDTKDRAPSHTNGNSDSDKAGGTKGTGSTGGQSGSDETSGTDGTSAGDEASDADGTSGDDEASDAEGTSGDDETAGDDDTAEAETGSYDEYGINLPAPAPDPDKPDESDPDPEPEPQVNIIDEKFDLLGTDKEHINGEIFSLDLKVAGPTKGKETDKIGGYASLGSTEFDVTVARVSVAGSPLPGLDIKAEGKFKTVNAEAELGGRAEFDGWKPKFEAQAKLGAETMALDGRAEATINIPITPAVNGAVDFYNSYVDPAVEFVAGRDVPNLPELTGDYDIALSGHVVGGFGVSAKGHFGAEFGKGTDNKFGGGYKLGAGPVFGFGVSMQLKPSD